MLFLRLDCAATKSVEECLLLLPQLFHLSTAFHFDDLFDSCSSQYQRPEHLDLDFSRGHVGNTLSLSACPPPAKPESKLPYIGLSQQSQFQGALKNAASSATPYDALRAAATISRADPTFIGDPALTPLATSLALFASALGVLQEEHNRPIEALSNQLRDLELVALLASSTSDADVPATPSALATFRKRPLIRDLPGLKPILSDRDPFSTATIKAKEAEISRQAEVKNLVELFGNYKSALSELTTVSGAHVLSTSQTPQAGSETCAELQPNKHSLRQADYVTKLSGLRQAYSLELLRTGSSTPGSASAQTHDLEDREATAVPVQEASGLTGPFALADTVLKAPTVAAPSHTAFKPLPPSSSQVLLNTDRINSLSATTSGVVTKENIPLNTTPLDRAVEQIRRKAEDTLRSLEKIAGPGSDDSIVMKNVGGTLLTIQTPRASAVSDIVSSGDKNLPLLFDTVPAARIPHSKGKLAPAGVADLLIVRQQLKAYEGADLSTVENVFKGEKRNREHTTTQTTTTVTTAQEEATDTQTRDLESTGRFELSKESENTIKTDQSLKGGLNVPASYGPFISVSASVEGAMSKSQTESTKTASRFSQDVTEKSARNITTKVLKTKSLTTTDEVQEKNIHSIDNSAGTDNISGVYQWVNKVYEAQMYNYGLRVTYAFMIPEPAAFYIEVFKRAHAAAVNINRPPNFALSPSSITEYNYNYWTAVFGATDIIPPPDYFNIYAKEVSMPDSQSSSTAFNKTDHIDLDAGYQAFSCVFTCTWVQWDNSVGIDVTCGGIFHRFVNGSDFVFKSGLNDEFGSIPVTMKTFYVKTATVGIEVKAVRTARALQQWQLDTFARLKNAHSARMQDYNDALAQAQLNSNIGISGTNPESNLITMRNEIKKDCIEILTDQHYDLFASINQSSSEYLPEVDLYQAEAEGAYVRFFEQAFEWEEMTWLTCPYYWGRKSQWTQRIAFSDPDPKFDEFLKAGFCRAVAPVRPGFESAVDHFLTYGEIWNGGPLPTISSAEYVPVANEIAERAAKPGAEIPQGDSWDVKIPTTLVKLRMDDSLPKWTKGSDGKWTGGV
ncbi:MAG: hypothetical protein M1831_001556 [Alyxoria varia]|nr:MAG: hypothetical protein M1831_001556 [Alyxoria varia]